MFSMQHITTMIFSLCILLLFQTAVAENEGESIVCQKEYLLYFVDKDPIIEESKLLPNGNIMIAYSCQSSDLSDPETRRYLSVFDQKGNLLSIIYRFINSIDDIIPFFIAGSDPTGGMQVSFQLFGTRITCQLIQFLDQLPALLFRNEF